MSTCHDPASSILFDGITPTPTALDGNVWARQLVILATPQFGYVSSPPRLFCDPSSPLAFSSHIKEPGDASLSKKSEFTTVLSRTSKRSQYNCPQYMGPILIHILLQISCSTCPNVFSLYLLTETM